MIFSFCSHALLSLCYRGSNKSSSFWGLSPRTAGGKDVNAMALLLLTGLAKGNRIIQILSAINCRFLGPNSR
jgi:hypothetical protein